MIAPSKLLIVTPCVPNGLPTQGSIIGERLRTEGVFVGMVSRARTPLGRVVEILGKGPWLVARYPQLLVDVFGERAFVYESFAIGCARLLRRRVIVVLHNGMLPNFVRRWPRWTKLILSMADVVVVPHEFLREQLAPLGIRIDGVIPNFIDLERYTFRKRSTLAPRFLYLRGMHAIYNPEMALRAFALIQARYPDATLTMTGRDGAESARCRALVEELSLRNVSFRGIVAKHEIARLADDHDIHLHTNRFDNMPVTILEMWACGLPIVGTDVGGMPHLVRDGIDAILVPSEDHRAMADACSRLLSRPELAVRLSVNGRARAEALTWPRVKPLWDRVLCGKTPDALSPDRLLNSWPDQAQQ